jgi:hypothetical protein
MWGQFFLATPWTDPTSATSDYFNACNLGSSNVPYSCGSPCFQYDRTGVAYAGLYACNGFLGPWEYIQVNLDSALKQNSCYYIEFY